MSADMIQGKVGRIYMPAQKVDTMALSKMKGLKREHRKATGAAVSQGLPKPRDKEAKAKKAKKESSLAVVAADA